VQVVHRAAAVSFEHVLVFVVVGREENDRNARRLLATLDGLGQLESGHSRHADVEDQQREFLGHQRQQRLVGRLGPHQSIARRIEHCLEHREVLRLVIHDQDVDGCIGDRRKHGARSLR
jgi:hypothetical protein